MDNPNDTYTSTMADLAAQGRAVAQAVEEFINGDHSGLSRDEFNQMQTRLLAKQKFVIDAMVAAMNPKTNASIDPQRSTLMQSEDADITEIKRLAGLNEVRPTQNQAGNFQTMKKIVQLATNFMQNHTADAELTAKNIIFLAQQIEKE